MGELSEIFQWRGEVKEGLEGEFGFYPCFSTIQYIHFHAIFSIAGFSEKDQEHVGEELSDVLLYTIRMADRCGVDLFAAAKRKIIRNGEKYPADVVRGSSKKYNEYDETSPPTTDVQKLCKQ